VQPHANDNDSGGQGRPGAILFVVGVSLMNAVSTMLVIPVLPRLVQEFTGSTAGAAHYVGLFATVFALVQW
jgi:MFS transporter, DHA1 family, tetracycline resistance protein